MVKSFKEKVIKIVKSIPKGKVLTYSQVAKMAGSPKASRAVGSILKANFSKDIPCHRVIRSDGKLGEYNGLRGLSKRDLLIKEGFKPKT